MDAIISGTELAAVCRVRYPLAYCRTLDADYNIPTEDSFSFFNKELTNHLFEFYGDKWQTFFDCENFALEAVVLACRKHFVSRRVGKGNASGVTVGILCFNLVPVDITTGHCIGVRLDTWRQLREFEPQNRQPLPLTPQQCLSVSLCLFF